MKKAIQRQAIFSGISIVGFVLLILICAQCVQAQCVKSPNGTTALKFSNESSYDLTFFIDQDEKVTLTPKTVSTEFPVEPGEHILRARAMIAEVSMWVYTGNEVPEGHVCTWTIDDPPKGRQRSANRFLRF